MNIERKGPNLLLFAIFTTLTIFVWIGAEVYQILHKRNLETIPPAVLNTFSPTLDTKALNDIDARKYFASP
ncbi:MAG: hypothetical protein A2782_04460 [Candidatus Blackburnbacteria bacterium RIFCSPHIGHO2_01_FULL_43_15b]|uniref:Uncharacterized protein n=1 Tax=Candidatus Blackburnbacteria bacterium RIFCSPHIGHO2_01_FULL_43_15b TaxID=1797513 RepID=A0A1G1V3J3_9BACT|nr:MAG: hypothetical protein A2782_04460 [Candidatus Blackburnbacteria bacterium RIFCSPHIGHO2_01_FULL_43_15b]